MRASEVDGRDARWERSSARYRLHVYRGAGGALTEIDFEDASLEDVLDSGAVFGRDGAIWSLALVVDDSADGRGLVWLSGWDYHGTPGTPVERRGRARMQDRYLMAESTQGRPVVLPDGRRVIRLFPDAGHDQPLWESFADRYTLTGADLGVSADLEARLRAWRDDWETAVAPAWHGVDDSAAPDDAWYDRGYALATELQAELGDGFEVRPDFDRRSLPLVE
ncbi:hypothetical protein [Agromyces seonyuensis]|uniref:Uncharacterized protein n=1 Tax=Agromyces seonyuensis TaxID=2662446 RepID=A0A6I4NSP8_9MICO|nr:hypothetical protein [Agromyces seonyuensis]MWB97200.1 hypothetical protein [Agromyces seonyuensis]